MTRWAVLLYFLEDGIEVFHVETFEDRWAAECYLAGVAVNGGYRGGRAVHVTHARLVPWL